jgi:hypothetical protein
LCSNFAKIGWTRRQVGYCLQEVPPSLRRISRIKHPRTALYRLQCSNKLEIFTEWSQQMTLCPKVLIFCTDRSLKSFSFFFQLQLRNSRRRVLHDLIYGTLPYRHLSIPQQKRKIFAWRERSHFSMEVRWASNLLRCR